MHAIITRLPLKSDVDWNLLVERAGALDKLAAARTADYRGLSFVRTGEEEATLLVVFMTKDALDMISREVAGPWFAENMRPFLAGPASRTVGEILAGSLGVA